MKDNIFKILFWVVTVVCFGGLVILGRLGYAEVKGNNAVHDVIKADISDFRVEQMRQGTIQMQSTKVQEIMLIEIKEISRKL